MAKAITLQALKKRNVPFQISVKGMGLGPLSAHHVSFAAKQAIEKLYNKDLLGGYVPELANETILSNADLILVMDKGLMKHKNLESILPKRKTYLFKEFFGERGNISDPWPDGKDNRTLERYLKCAKEMQKLIDNGIDRILNAL